MKKPIDHFAAHYAAKDEAEKFSRLLDDLDKLVAYATLAKEKVDEAHDNLKDIARMEEEAAELLANIDEDDNAAEYADLTKRLEKARNTAHLAVARSEGVSRSKPGLDTLLSIIKDYGDFSSFKSDLLDKAIAEERK